MKTGAFSISLAVKDIDTSKEFYEKLGFKMTGGDTSQKWAIMKNEMAMIGLFEGMFEGNIITFNPGWDQNAQLLEEFDDVRTIQQHLKNSGIVLTEETEQHGTGPAHISLKDPDGNVILIDQHR